MAKKTNKTDHVLNLLAGAAKKDDVADIVEQEDKKAQPPVDPLEQMKSKVSVHHTSNSGEAVIADAVKQSLEQEIMEAEEASVKEEPKVETETSAPEEPKVEAEVSAPEESKMEEETSATEESKMEEETSAPEESKTQENISVPEKSEVPEESEIQKEPEVQEEPEKETPLKGAPVEERTFEFVNVMERLVRDKVVGYMEQFGNCTCDRCIEDTTALSLSHLSAKCVVVNKEAVSPLLNFYTNKYAGQITVEITKSCITVKNNPNH